MGLWWPDTLSKLKWTSTPSKPDPASSKSLSAATRSKRSRDTRTSLLLQPGLLEPHAHLLRPSSCPAPSLPHLQMPFQPPYPPSGPPCSLLLLEVYFIFVPPLSSSWPTWGRREALCILGRDNKNTLFIIRVLFLCSSLHHLCSHCGAVIRGGRLCLTHLWVSVQHSVHLSSIY